MKEMEYLIKQGTLITEKQYKKILLIIIINFTLSLIICLGGMTIMLLSDSLLIAGLSIFGVGTFLLIFDVVFLIIKYAAKIQLYRHYKKYPEDFESDIEL